MPSAARLGTGGAFGHSHAAVAVRTRRPPIRDATTALPTLNIAHPDTEPSMRRTLPCQRGRLQMLTLPWRAGRICSLDVRSCIKGQVTNAKIALYE